MADGVEHHERYGRNGQAQQGIDIFVRLAGGRYDVWQVKRRSKFSAGDLSAAVDKFLGGTWVGKAARLIVAVQADTADTGLQDELEKRAAELRASGITLILLGPDQLSLQLKNLPEIVDDFFGRNWAGAFNGEAACGLEDRLDGRQFAQVRSQLATAYSAWFQLLDPGVVSAPGGMEQSPAPSPLERLVMPDVSVRESTVLIPREISEKRIREQRQGNDGWDGSFSTNRPSHDLPDPGLNERVPFDAWVASADQLALIGDAGMGKSLLLRCLAMDLIGDQSRFPAAGRRWGRRLPLYISFARWTKAAEQNGKPVALYRAVADSLQDLLTIDLSRLVDNAIDEHRIVLLIDGLDEWTDAQAASSVLVRLLAFVKTHAIPTVVSGRPGGLARIGAIPSDWRRGVVATLTQSQQADLADSWFERLARLPQGNVSAGARRQALVQSERFLSSLNRDRRVSGIAGTPLLLLGLLSVWLRGGTLPSNRVEALRELTHLLLETHPERRATAAGDVRARFVHLPDYDMRRAALAKLAYEVRMLGADEGLPVAKAKAIVRDYLTSDEHGFEPSRARLAAEELLAVNAETVGLIVEKAAGEIGFSHASLTEYLAATHVHEWPLADVLSFVTKRSGDARWRTVLATLTVLAARAEEVESLVRAIEEAELDVISDIERRLLLAEIAFGPARRPRSLTNRLLRASFNDIEGGDWPEVRTETLRLALDGLNDPVVGPAVEARIPLWGPRLSTLRTNLMSQLGRWPRGSDLASTLAVAMRDEDDDTRQAAAQALASVYRGDASMLETLLCTLASTSDFGHAAALLDALSLGWPADDRVGKCLASALESASPDLRLAGAVGRVALGAHDGRDLEVLLSMVSTAQDYFSHNRWRAGKALSAGWPNDPDLVKRALRSLRERRAVENEMEDTIALEYLSDCDPAMPGISDWFISELEGPHSGHPLPYFGFRWSALAPFAQVYPRLREVLVRYLSQLKAVGFGHRQHDLVALLRDDRLRDRLIDLLHFEPVSGSISTYWLLSPLVKGWGREDAKVAAVLDEVAAWPPRRLAAVTRLIPALISDNARARQVLLEVAREPRARRGLVDALCAVGAGPDDEEAVEAILGRDEEEGSLWDEFPETVLHFGSNPRVRAVALRSLDGRFPPLASIAAVYGEDEDFRPVVLASAVPLPGYLRRQLADADGTNSPALLALRRGFDRETDPAIKVNLASAHYRRLWSEGGDEQDLYNLEHLAKSIGPDLDERRAAAFAGFLALGRLENFASMQESGKPMRISTGGMLGHVPRLLADIASRWEIIEDAFGQDVVGRFGWHEVRPSVFWEQIASYLPSGGAAERAFLSHCSSMQEPLGLQGLRALARASSGTRVLHQHCWRLLEGVTDHYYHSLDLEAAMVEAAYLLADGFALENDDAARIASLALERRTQASAVAWCLLDPNAVRARSPLAPPLAYGERDGSWLVAGHLAMVRSSSTEFVEVTRACVSRSLHRAHDMQPFFNRAIGRRLVRDEEAVSALRTAHLNAIAAAERASLPRLLAETGAANSTTVDACRKQIAQTGNRPFIEAAYDAVSDRIRPTVHVLRDVVSSLDGL